LTWMSNMSFAFGTRDDRSDPSPERWGSPQGRSSERWLLKNPPRTRARRTGRSRRDLDVREPWWNRRSIARLLSSAAYLNKLVGPIQTTSEKRVATHRIEAVNAREDRLGSPGRSVGPQREHALGHVLGVGGVERLQGDGVGLVNGAARSANRREREQRVQLDHRPWGELDRLRFITGAGRGERRRRPPPTSPGNDPAKLPAVSVTVFTATWSSSVVGTTTIPMERSSPPKPT